MNQKNKNLNSENSQEKDSRALSKGELLKSERVKKGVSLEVVHEETKIPLDALRAIEEGYNIRTLSDFYYNGFLKIYAKYLNIDVNKVVDATPSRRIVNPISSDPSSDFNLEEWIAKVFTRKAKQQIAIVIGMIVAFFLLFKIITFFVSLGKKDPKPVVKKEKVQEAPVKVETPVEVKKEEKVSVSKKEKQETLTALSQNKNQEDKTKAPDTAPQATSLSSNTAKTETPAQSPEKGESSPNPIKSPNAQKQVTLTVRATKESWLRVEVDGQVEFQSTLKMGSVETWFADKEIVISGRNITFLEFELNGKMIGKLGRKDRKVKEVKITKDGLQVSK